MTARQYEAAAWSFGVIGLVASAEYYARPQS